MSVEGRGTRIKKGGKEQNRKSAFQPPNLFHLNLPQLCVSDTDYMVEFKTANEPNAGTDSNVYFKLLGEGGETENFQLGDNSEGSHFQPGQTDKFNTRGKNVGKVSETLTITLKNKPVKV